MSEENIPNVCLGCEPDRDPLREIFSIYQCPAHTQDTSGTLDRLVTSASYLSGGSEIEGLSNRAWCDFFHRQKTS